MAIDKNFGRQMLHLKLAFFLFIALVIPFTLYAVQQQTNTNSNAAELTGDSGSAPSRRVRVIEDNDGDGVIERGEGACFNGPLQLSVVKKVPKAQRDYKDIPWSTLSNCDVYSSFVNPDRCDLISIRFQPETSNDTSHVRVTQLNPYKVVNYPRGTKEVSACGPYVVNFFHHFYEESGE